jgi:hypothetical protein
MAYTVTLTVVNAEGIAKMDWNATDAYIKITATLSHIFPTRRFLTPSPVAVNWRPQQKTLLLRYGCLKSFLNDDLAPASPRRPMPHDHPHPSHFGGILSLSPVFIRMPRTSGQAWPQGRLWAGCGRLAQMVLDEGL